MNIFEKDHTYIADTYARFPINIVKGSGALLYDENGNLAGAAGYGTYYPNNHAENVTHEVYGSVTKIGWKR